MSQERGVEDGNIYIDKSSLQHDVSIYAGQWQENTPKEVRCDRHCEESMVFLFGPSGSRR